MEETRLREFGNKDTAAWCSQNPASVAAFFMTAFPDMVVRMDSVSIEESRAVNRSTLTGMNTGPGGTGKAVRISGYEEWTFGVRWEPDGV